MRFKFRVWDKINKCWYKPIYKAYNGYVEELLINLNGDLCMRKVKSGIENLYHESTFKDRFEVSWSTGLYGNNNKEICIGHIFHLGDENIKYIIEWNDSGFKGRQLGTNGSYIGLIHWLDRIEIMGNKYENPELLT